MNENDLEFYKKQLKSDECFCGSGKNRRYAFCFKCYISLPEEIREDLYKPIGRGFETAFEDAIEYLRHYVW